MRRYEVIAHALAVCSFISAPNACGDAHTRGASTVSGGLKLQSEKCTAVSAEQRDWMGVEWQPFLPYVRACEVKRANSVALYVISVWVDEYEAHLPKDDPATRFPKPLIVSKDAKTVGRLPIGFRRDPPRSSDVTFAKWSDGFPLQIWIKVDDPTVTGNSTVLLEWNAQSNSFGQSKTK
jgi:hypothetical protein